MGPPGGDAVATACYFLPVALGRESEAAEPTWFRATVLYDRATSDLVAARTDARVLLLPTSVGGAPGASNYERLIDMIVEAFVRAAGSPRG